MQTAEAQELRVLFAGGGTGGHLMPAVATAQTLRELHWPSTSLFLTTPRCSEAPCYHALAEFETAQIPAARWAGDARQKIKFAPTAVRACERSLDFVRHFRPHVVVGLGGYSCVPPVMVARVLAVPVVLFESNAVPGRAVRLLAPVANSVQLQWPEAARLLKARLVLVTGNPVRPALFQGSRRKALERFVLAPDRLTLLVMGGSQGAQSLNRLLVGALKHMGRWSDRVLPQRLQVLHITGPDHLAEIRESEMPWRILYRPVGFVQHMEDAYLAADLVVSRAGGSCLAEITALGLPSVLVPYPHAADEHQSANAEVLARAGASIVLSEEGLTERKLANLLAKLVKNPAQLCKMARAARALGRPDAARAVAAEIMRMAGLNNAARSPGGQARSTATLSGPDRKLVA